LRQSGIEIEEVAALSERQFFRAVGQQAEVADTHEALGQDVKQEATDKFLGIKEEGLCLITVFV